MRADVLLPPPPADLLEGGDGGDSGWVELLQVPNDVEAHLLTGWLAQDGIETQRLVHRAVSPAWLFGGSNPWTPVTVLVRRLQLDDARIALAEMALRLPPAVPGGGPVLDWRGVVAWWIAAIALGVLFTGLALARTADALRSCELPLLCGDKTEQAPEH